MVQTDIFGGVKVADVRVMELARQIMHDKPITYRSHRMLMREVAKAIGCKFIHDLDSEEMQRFDMLIDLSPDFERSARKVREEDEERQKNASRGIAPRNQSTE